MTLDQIRIFLAVAEREHVTRAAAVLNLTQSTVSGAIAALESRHDVKLFHRVGRRIELTEEGAIFADKARAILSAVRSAEATLADLGSVPRGTLSIFASQTIAGYWLPRHLVRFREMYPEIVLQLEAGNTAECVQAVKSGAADIGFIEGAIDEPEVSVKLVTHDRLVIIVGRNHPWATQPPASPQELTAQQWVLREKGSGTRSSFEDALRLHRIQPAQLRVAIELPSNEAICNAVAAGQYPSAVSDTVAQMGVKTGGLVTVPLELSSRAFSVILHRERHQSRASRAFRDMLTTVAEVSTGTAI